MKVITGYYIYCTEYKHYRTGKIMRASDYGKTAWKFWVPKKENKKLDK